MSDVSAAYTTSESDGFSVETNTAVLDTPAETTDTPETPAQIAARDERGRFAGKPADDDAETDSETEPEPVKAETKPPKRSLDRMIWEREEAKRQAKAADERASRLEAELADARKPRAPEAPAKPAGEKFAFASYDAYIQEHPDASYEDYIEERAVARIEHKRATEEREKAAREQGERLQQWGAAHRAREIEARRQFTDYDQRLTEAQDALTAAGFAHLPAALGRAILESERSAQITYDLATHPEVALQLARESIGLPESAAPVMRRLLEQRLSAASSGPAETTKVTSSAKPVIKPVTGTPATTDADDEPDDDDLDGFIKRENARQRKAGRW